jgi:hypothetical protein
MFPPFFSFKKQKTKYFEQLELVAGFFFVKNVRKVLGGDLRVHGGTKENR